MAEHHDCVGLVTMVAKLSHAKKGFEAQQARLEATAVRGQAPRDHLLADLEARGMIVVSEAFDPGWQAKEGRTLVPLFPCDLAVMAIELGPGHHEVELAYEPPGWDLAILASALGLGVTLVLLFKRRRLSQFR